MPNPVCVCGHAREAHEHYRRGTDCATCGPELCPKFRRPLLRRRTPPAPPSSRDRGPSTTEYVAQAPLLTGPLAIVTDLRAYAAGRLPAV